ncbi:MAG TPA: hypothetical protein VJC11_01165 [Patescibacteria group bacterium]|nr:hypothetical protein [Patescibacteria group bacterium]
MKNKKSKESKTISKEGKYYVVQGLNSDVSSFGRTKQEALKNFKEARALSVESTDQR